MNRSRLLAAAAVMMMLVSCSTPPAPPPTEQARLDRDTARVEHEIKTTCLGSGLFKFADGAIAAAVPAAGIPIALVNAGVDFVCAHPDRFAQDASTVEWLTRNFKAEIAKRHPPN
jgi:hypothetical protein